MVSIYPGYQNESSTYYQEAKLNAAVPEEQEAIVRVPGGAGAITFDIYGEAKRFSLYVTNSNIDDILSNKENVVWHETEFINVSTDLFAVVSAVVGAYRLICHEGSIEVKVRGK